MAGGFASAERSPTVVTNLLLLNRVAHANPAGARRRAARVLAVAAVAGAVLLASSSARAAAPTYYAAPIGSTTADCTSAAEPCDLRHALDVAPDGADITVTSGTYLEHDPIEVYRPVTLHGPVGGPRPAIVDDHASCFGCASPALDINVGDVVLRDLRVVGSGGSPGAAAILVQPFGGQGNVILERVVVEGDDGTAILTYSRMLIRDSILWAPQGPGAAISFEQSHTDVVQLENVDAIAGPGAGYALTVHRACIPGAGCPPAVEAENSIFEGGTGELNVTPAGVNPGYVTVQLSHSNYRLATPSGAVTGPAMNGNQSEWPGFAAPQNGDFHELPTSPTVNAGIAGALLGGADLDGNARISGSSADIGAYELQEALPNPPAPPTGGDTPPPPGTPPPGGAGGGVPSGGSPSGPTTARFAGVRIGGGSRHLRHGVVRIRVSCPASASGGCTGRLALTVPRVGHHARPRVLGRATLRLRAGRKAWLALRIRTRALRRARTPAVATVVAHDAHGLTRTTTAKIRVLRR
jgi:hypothetical protein